MKKKVCKSCKIFVEGNQCPLCKNSQFTTNWKGRIAVLDPVKSEIARKIDLKAQGEYAIKAR